MWERRGAGLLVSCTRPLPHGERQYRFVDALSDLWVAASTVLGTAGRVGVEDLR